MSEIASKVKAIIVDKLGVDENDVTPEACILDFYADIVVDNANYASCRVIAILRAADFHFTDDIEDAGGSNG